MEISFKQFIKEGVVKLPDDAKAEIKRVLPIVFSRLYKLSNLYKIGFGLRKRFNWTSIGPKFDPKWHYITSINYINPFSGENETIQIITDVNLDEPDVNAFTMRRTRVNRHGRYLPQSFYDITKRKPCIVIYFGANDEYIHNVEELEDTLTHEVIHIIDPKSKLILYKPKKYFKKLTGMSYHRTKKEKEQDPSITDYKYVSSPVEIDAFMRQVFNRLENRIDKISDKKDYINTLENVLRYKDLKFLRVLGSLAKLGSQFESIIQKPTLVKKLKRDFYQFIQELKYRYLEDPFQVTEIYRPPMRSRLGPFKMPNIIVYNILVKVQGGEWHRLEQKVVAKNIADAVNKIKNTSIGAQYKINDNRLSDNIQFWPNFDETKKYKDQLLQQYQTSRKEEENRIASEYRRIQSMPWNTD